MRHSAVLHLEIQKGMVHALVSGGEIYEVNIHIAPLAQERWEAIQRQCAGSIASLVELLQGTFSEAVMEVVTRKDEGLFPSPREMRMSCSCPDWAIMCKHVAATLYGVGARLDEEPELLFSLRGVDPSDLVAAAVAQPVPASGDTDRDVLDAEDLSSLFGVDILEKEAPSQTSRSPASGSEANKPKTARSKASKAKASTAKTKSAATETSKAKTPKAKASSPKAKTSKSKTGAKSKATAKSNSASNASKAKASTAKTKSAATETSKAKTPKAKAPKAKASKAKAQAKSKATAKGKVSSRKAKTTKPKTAKSETAKPRRSKERS